MDEKIEALAGFLKEAENIAFFGGAGVSTESGLKDYRSKDGIYFTAKNFGRPPEEILSRDCFFGDTELFYRFYREFFLSDALPGAAHKALARLENDGKNVTVITRGGQRYTGVVELRNASKHVNRELDSEKRDDTTLEILLDEEVSSREDVERLGIAVGDIVCLDPRARVTESGFIRSRFLDDKLSAGMLLTLARGVAEGTVRLSRKVTLFFSVYEEVGHGASCGLPEDTEDLLVVDMGCVGEGLSCREQQVSICAKDSSGPYDYEMTGELIALAKSNGIDYAVDVYPAYGSDAAAALRAGRDVRFALIGAGVYASHGYERSHRKGVENTLRLIEAAVTA